MSAVLAASQSCLSPSRSSTLSSPWRVITHIIAVCRCASTYFAYTGSRSYEHHHRHFHHCYHHTTISATTTISDHAIVTASRLLCPPPQRLKSRQQYAAAKTRGSPPGGWALATSTVQREGVLALWNGVTPSVIRTSLGVGVQFTVLDYLLRLPTYSKGSQDLDGGHGRGGDHAGGHGAGDGAPGSATVLSAGAIARTVSCAALHPISVVKVRMETYREHRYTGPASALREIARSEGVAGLYAGLGAALLRDVPYSSAYIFFYQRLLSTAARLRGDSGGGAKSLPFSITFGTGLMAGLAATCISHPFDVIKTRLQLDRLPQPTSGVMCPLLQSSLSIFFSLSHSLSLALLF